MFAFAYYSNNELSFAIDHFGEKPFYFYLKDEGLYFSSEITTLIKLFDLVPEMSFSECQLFAGIDL